MPTSGRSLCRGPQAAALLLCLGALHPAVAQKSTSPRPTLEALRIDAPIRVDGVLDEAAWQQAPVSPAGPGPGTSAC